MLTDIIEESMKMQKIDAKIIFPASRQQP